MQEMFNKDIEEIKKKSQSIMNNAITERPKALWREPTVD